MGEVDAVGFFTGLVGLAVTVVVEGLAFVADLDAAVGLDARAASPLAAACAPAAIAAEDALAATTTDARVCTLTVTADSRIGAAPVVAGSLLAVEAGGIGVAARRA
jgi:hypothetical protein